jgi:hypothetical protein
MAGIADQLKLWAKGRKPPKGKTPEGKEDDKGLPPKGGKGEGDASAGDDDSDAAEPKPPFAKETTPGKPVSKEDKPKPFEKGKKSNPFAAFAKGKK